MDKCKDLADKCLLEGKSVIIDNTNPSLEVSRTPKHRLIINPVAKPQFSARHGLGVLAACGMPCSSIGTSKSGHPTVCAARGCGWDCQHSLQRLGVDTLLKRMIFCAAAGTGSLHLNRKAAQCRRSMFSHDCHEVGIGTLQQDTAREWVSRAGWSSLNPLALKGPLAWHEVVQPEPQSP